ncbi:hypothetical protein [Polynucleobacter sp. 39-46-10]|uniref:hypothetical protein n=1 Tax=Polynucleobacter sp. 39-46-10 TaxID=1970428 RepID=UPI000BCB711A|nr:hypothetical protein [Polynucleobacter sp. 39-46-10]OYY21099.1 MAG: hypothetical protein B7Y67_03150 [Polynucleobacter sp. 35-46-11]OZA78290.1 MAG: hypothetical protein B7X71_01625 [Polynucleobacter sp. 39-46-10]
MFIINRIYKHILLGSCVSEPSPQTRANPPANPLPAARAPGPSGEEAELSIGDIVDFVAAHYRQLLLAALLGGVVGFLGWQFLGSYQAELTLLNSNKVDATRGEGGLDLVSWRAIAQSLPNLADQIVQEGKAPEGSEALYRQMSEPAWWQKNAQPTYALSKADMKDLAAIGKELDGASTSILSITMGAAAQSREAALQNVRQAAHFMLSGGAYLQLRNVLNGYESEAIATRAEIDRQISATQIELAYLQARAVSLEGLLKRFPADQKQAGQVVDPKDSGAKYLPIGTQIIAVNTEIHQKRELLSRLGDRLTQIEITKRFLQEAIPRSRTQFDGVQLAGYLLELERGIRQSLPPADLKARLPLDLLRARVLIIKDRFSNGLQANTAPTAKKRGMVKSTAAGTALGLGLALMWLLGRALLRRARRDKGAAPN